MLISSIASVIKKSTNRTALRLDPYLHHHHLVVFCRSPVPLGWTLWSSCAFVLASSLPMKILLSRVSLADPNSYQRLGEIPFSPSVLFLISSCIYPLALSWSVTKLKNTFLVFKEHTQDSVSIECEFWHQLFWSHRLSIMLGLCSVRQLTGTLWFMLLV